MPFDVRAAKAVHENAIFGRANVVGVAVGSKIIHGHDTNERWIVAFVERKRPEDELRHHDVVPKEIDGVLPDVVETGRFMAIPLVQSMDENRTHRVRPASGGVSIGHYRITAGTLGVLVHRHGRPAILSNNHVLANENAGQIGDPILQPGPDTAGRLQDEIARYTTFVPIRFNEGSMLPVAHFAERAITPLTPIL